jgi:hypothetical protein
MNLAQHKCAVYLMLYTVLCDALLPQELRKRGCLSELALMEALSEVKEEVQHRRSRGKVFLKTRQEVEMVYKKFHPEIYTLKEEYLCEGFRDAVAYSKRKDATIKELKSFLTVEEGEDIFSFPVFTGAFCSRLLEELDAYEECPVQKSRPNTMNRYGILLAELGFDSFFDKLREEYVLPLSKLLYPEWLGEDQLLDSQRAFTVKYTLGGDKDLSYHYDNAEVTLNVCLGKEFTGGDLLFGRMWGVPCSKHKMTRVKHVVGRGILHRGRHMHLATPLEEGERDNLIVWMRSSSVRCFQCPMCHKEPRLVPFEGFGEGFTCTATSLV